MSEIDSALSDLLRMVRDLAGKNPYAGADVSSVLGNLADTGLLDLAADTFELAGSDSLDWVSRVIREIAQESGATAYFLASRYVSQRAQLRQDDTEFDPESLAAIARTDDEALLATTVPLARPPSVVVLIDPSDVNARAFATTEFETVSDGPRRPGLVGASLGAIRATTRLEDCLLGPNATAACADWDILVASAAVGVAAAALTASVEYAQARRQFGGALASFAGLRALIAEMSDRIDSARSVLATAIAIPADSRAYRAAATAAAARAGQTAVDVSIAAVQVHGGYGYIEEFPIAGYFRDAVSLRARGTSTLIAQRHTADEQLGPVPNRLKECR